jgi:nucleoside triphosphate diphosphatase
MTEHAIERLIAIMARLRDPQHGCPWDIEQDFRSIAPYTIEEAHEVADAIERGDLDALKDELGDLLFQVVFHARMASEIDVFGFDDVVHAVSDKLIRRHPHVFGDDHIADADAQTRNWEAIKAAERAEQGNDDTSILAGISRGLPALRRSVKLQKRAASVGFDWPEVEPIYAKLAEETDELRQAVDSEDPDQIEDEIGDLLFVLTNLARRLKVDPGAALRRSNHKFEQRFRAMEALAEQRGLDLAELDIEAQESLYQEVKQAVADSA